MDEASLIRFVADPTGAIVPDLARRLPGRGVWVASERAAVETAARKGLFARALRAPASAGEDLAQRTADLLRARALAGLGLARKAGALTWGFSKVISALEAGRAAWLVEASDGADDGRRKLLGAARRGAGRPRVLGAFSCDELGLALGADNVIHLAFLAGRSADRWTVDVERLGGFVPLLPESWREERETGSADSR